MSFTPVFPGTAIYPSDVTYLELELTEDVTLSWPNQQQNDGNVVAAIIDLIADAAGRSVIMPDARQTANGYTALFNNVDVETVSIKDAGGSTIMTVASGEAWEMYLADNSTEDGVWRVFQYGAGASSANAGALAGAGLKAITTTLNQRMLPSVKIVDYPVVNADRARIIQWEGGVGTLTLPNPATVGNDWFVGIKNAGTGTIAVTASSGTIDDAASLSLPPGESTYIYSDGTDMWSFGLGQAVNSVFDFISIAIPGTGDYVLSGAQLNRVSYRFTGILTGDRNIVVPSTVQQYWVDNQTTGAFTIFVKTAPQVTGVEVPQGRRSILYSDGTDVVNAETFIVSTPVSIADGGTGQTTAVTALAALGGAPLTRILTAGSGLTGGGDLSADRTFAVGAGTGISVNADDVALDTANTRNVDHAAVVLTAGQGMTGGGDLTASRSFDIGAGSGIVVNANDVALDTTNFRNVDHSAVTMDAGAGLTGGGDISANRTFNVGAGTGIVVNADDVALDTANTRNIDHSIVIINGSNSITGGGDITASQTLQLDGDVLAPGNLFYYGTDAGGVKGFFALPNAAARTWQNVAASRALNTNYTNSTGGEIEVNFSGVCDSGNAQTMLVDGITVGASAQNTSTGSMSISVTVPDGSVYRVNGSAAGGSFTWAELRP